MPTPSPVMPSASLPVRFKLFDDLQRVVYCPMRSLSADIDNGADSAGIMLAFLFGESMLMCLFHAFLSPLPL